jgi:arylsulfatase A-like enzyme
MSTAKRMAVVALSVAAVGVSARLWVIPAQARTAAAASKPNIIVILADDLGYGDSSAYGSTIIRTPNIDALAASGVRFTNGYVTHPVCAPSRAGLLTGRYQERFGYDFNGSDKGGGVSLNEIMLPKAMKEAGYATGMVGKWHQGPKGPFYPTARGFDFFWGMSGGGTNYITDLKPFAAGDPGTAGSTARSVSADEQLRLSARRSGRVPLNRSANPFHSQSNREATID